MNLNTSSDRSFRRYYKPLEPLITKPQNRVYTATILSFLVISLFLWYAVRPTMQTIFALRREIRDNQEISKQMEEKISALVQAQSTYQMISQDLPLLSEAVPREPDPLKTMIAIKNLATRTGVTLSALQLPNVGLMGNIATPAGSTNIIAGEPLRVDFNISVNGSYEGVHQFVEGVINMRRILTVQDVSIFLNNEGESINLNDPQLRAVLKLNMFYLPGGSL